jgi:hypothetical protein
MSIRKIIDWAISDASNQLTGKIVSPFFQKADNSGDWTWACDVDLCNGEANSVLRSVPIATNNWDILYAEQGKGVTLSRMGNSQWAITGLSKDMRDTVHITLVTFYEDTYDIIGTRTIGNVYRPLTYGELGTLMTLAPGYGVLPYGIQGKFDFDGNFIEFMEY